MKARVRQYHPLRDSLPLRSGLLNGLVGQMPVWDKSTVHLSCSLNSLVAHRRKGPSMCSHSRTSDLLKGWVKSSPKLPAAFSDIDCYAVVVFLTKPLSCKAIILSIAEKLSGRALFAKGEIFVNKSIYQHQGSHRYLSAFVIPDDKSKNILSIWKIQTEGIPASRLEFLTIHLLKPLLQRSFIVKTKDWVLFLRVQNYTVVSRMLINKKSRASACPKGFLKNL